MLSPIKNLLRKVIPLAVRRYLGGFFYGYFGPFPTWAAAQAKAIGYDDDQILAKVSTALTKVKNGEAVYERDSVLFDRIETAWPLLAGLLYIAQKQDGRLDLIDFGGSLGSSYFQNRPWLEHLKSLSWKIVEQPKFVTRGRALFETETLRFFSDLDEAGVKSKPSAILFSSSLQYLPDPAETLRKVIKNGYDYLIFDRTGFTDQEEDLVTLQKVPPQIYSASYPCWFFSEQKFLETLATDYNKLADWEALGGHYNRHGLKADFKGFLFERKQK